MKEKRIEAYVGDEEIVWRGNAKSNDYLTCRLVNLLPIAFIWLALEMVALSFAVTAEVLSKEGSSTWFLLINIGAVLLHLIPTALWALAVSRENARINGEEYAITEKYLYILRSPLHESIEKIELSSIVDARKKSSLAEKIFMTGRIVVETEDEKIILYSIENADKNFKKIYRALLGGEKGE